MTIPWSIATAVRNPERFIKFLELYKSLEGQNWNKKLQKKYQILLIQHREYEPTKVPGKYNIKKKTGFNYSYEEAEEILLARNYVGGPDLRGRQSANPLVKLGFAYPANKQGITSSICGQAPSFFPDLTERLVKWGITSVSVSPDSIDSTRNLVYRIEQQF